MANKTNQLRRLRQSCVRFRRVRPG
jgi:hypothetical protein